MRWLFLAVLGPLALLAVLAWIGLRAQLDNLVVRAEQTAIESAARDAELLAAVFRSSVARVPAYPDPPVPGERSEKDDILDGEDLDALRTLRDDPEAGISPAGLPRRALAALRLHELSPGEDLTGLVTLLTTEAPSAITGRALERVGVGSAEIEAWQVSDQARELAGTGDTPPEGIWHRTPEANWWLRKEGGDIEFIRFGSASDADAQAVLIAPPAALSVAGRALFPDTRLHAPAAEIFTTDLAFPPGVALISELDVSNHEALLRSQQTWLTALLAGALGVAGLALFLIQRTVARERRLAELKSQFVASVSHELRAPLGSIRLMAEALQQGKVARPGEFHTLIAREGARLSHLIENVLDSARIDEGRKRYRFEESDLTALVRDCLRVMQPLAEDRRVHLAFELPEITATLDPAAIQQAVINLLDNAIKHSPAGSIVHVELAEKDGAWSISIRDHGPGIPPAEQRRIFERFHRLGDELRRETQGTGIGLSIVKHVAEAHHGTITVTSDPPHGATFILTLPIDPITNHQSPMSIPPCVS